MKFVQAAIIALLLCVLLYIIDITNPGAQVIANFVVIPACILALVALVVLVVKDG